ncbi:MutS-related protein [Flavihumibacter profundi]|uniref:MutS-related protein n=1 Tax=Flavihumibacter profundi TaxID=2716883 RepID=UPI001CC3FC6C|nr:DNA mismatch repair protein MutS [Flavihumibacter profundi]MBZ5858198.1 DNA mismatch repair protein MutS [Flavihumibacter profundi]
MDIDKTSLLDLSIFHQEEEHSIFHHLNYTRTADGKAWLMHLFREPFNESGPILQTQQILKIILSNVDQWPMTITNGTIMVMEKFYDAQIDPIPHSHNLFNGFIYKLTNGPDFAMVKYSIGHFSDFVRGFRQLIDHLSANQIPANLRIVLERSAQLLKDPHISELANLPAGYSLTPVQVVYFGHFLHNRYKNQTLELIHLFARLDAWYSMAVAMKENNLCFPEISESGQPFIEAEGLYHILIPAPVSYDVTLDKQHNFLFLTGANMAGKSTFIRSVGAAVYLAHLGMGVPAKNIKLSLFEGILSNINVSDNIIKGESYFFNEVQRIKNTIQKINDGHKWLVLIDELFKGTNVQDAMKCSLAVIKGLIKINNSLFILSTHLYEIGEELKSHPNIIFRYFETAVKDDQLEFGYHLKEGISNDRLGYLILKREKVIDLLEKL